MDISVVVVSLDFGVLVVDGLFVGILDPAGEEGSAAGIRIYI